MIACSDTEIEFNDNGFYPRPFIILQQCWVHIY